VVTVEPEVSGDESDLGMGSESDESIEGTLKEEVVPASKGRFKVLSTAFDKVYYRITSVCAEKVLIFFIDARSIFQLPLL